MLEYLSRPGMLLALVLTACAPQDVDQRESSERAALLQTHALYTAWDGVHDYRVLARASADAVDSLMWTVNEHYLELTTAADDPASVSLRALQPGTTMLTLHARSSQGTLLVDEAMVEITETAAEQWDRGRAFFVGEDPAHALVTPFSEEAWHGSGPCQLSGPPAVLENGCASCHAQAAPDAERFSDAVLLKLLTQGEIPDGITYTRPLPRMLPRDVADCLFANEHAAVVPEELGPAVITALRGYVGQAEPIEPSKLSRVNLKSLIEMAE